MALHSDALMQVNVYLNLSINAYAQNIFGTHARLNYKSHAVNEKHTKLNTEAQHLEKPIYLVFQLAVERLWYLPRDIRHVIFAT